MTAVNAWVSAIGFCLKERTNAQSYESSGEVGLMQHCQYSTSDVQKQKCTKVIKLQTKPILCQRTQKHTASSYTQTSQCFYPDEISVRALNVFNRKGQLIQNQSFQFKTSYKCESRTQKVWFFIELYLTIIIRFIISAVESRVKTSL